MNTEHLVRLTGAQRGERSPKRVTHLNDYRPRVWKTRVGEIAAHIPRTRNTVWDRRNRTAAKGDATDPIHSPRMSGCGFRPPREPS
jgi:transposase-like protein